jgi:serine/threonine-protein kinase
VKTKQPHSPPPPKSPPPAGTGTNTLRKLCVGTALATQAACANVPVAQLPKPAECPPGAMKAMTETLGNLFSPASNEPFHRKGPNISLAEGNIHWMPVRPGDVSVLLWTNWGTLPPNTVLTGEFYFGEGRVFGRFTRAWTPQGTSFPICAELWRDVPEERGLDMKPGSTRDDVQIWSNAMVVPVRHFD